MSNWSDTAQRQEGRTAKKAWRVFKVYLDGKRKMTSYAYNRERVVTQAWMLALGMVRYHPDGESVRAIEIKAPDGRIWRHALSAPQTPEEAAASEARLKALPAEELQRMKARASQRVSASFEGEPIIV